MIYLSVAWSDPGNRDRIRAALAAADIKLPIIEALVLATAAAYAMYLLATQGKTKKIRAVVRQADGSFGDQTVDAPAGPFEGQADG